MPKLPSPTFWPGIVTLIISTILLVIPGSSIPDENWMGTLHIDKVVHVIMFSSLTFIWCWGSLKLNLGNERLRKWFLIIACCLFLYGWGMEFVQKYLVVNRSFDPGDVLADAGGSLLGLVIANWKLIQKN